MSIAAKISRLAHENGKYRLILVDADRGEPASQQYLDVENGSSELIPLVGEVIWGGASSIMHGDTKIAERIGYTRIKMVDGWNKSFSKLKRTVN